jgi:DNA polymerase-3 subunit beta
MKLTVTRNDLWKGIDTVLDVVPSKPALPVLSNICMRATEDGLYLSATDLDLSVTTHIQAKVESTGSITVPARTFADITREWPETELSIVVEKERLQLFGNLGDSKSGEGAYNLSGMPTDEFPKTPTSIEGLTLSLQDGTALNSAKFLEMISKTAFAVSKDDTRPVLNGVFWHIVGNKMEMVSTDGSRLACYRTSLDLDLQDVDEARVIVPPQALNKISKILADSQESPKITLGQTQILFKTGKTHLSSRLIEGPYVDYAQVLPKSNEKELCVDSNLLHAAVKRVSVLASAYTRQVRLKLGDSSIELSTASPEIGGEAREVIPAVYDGENFDVGYNAQFLMEIIRKMDTPTVVFKLSDAVTAAVVKSQIDDDGVNDYFCLLMPLRPAG